MVAFLIAMAWVFFDGTDTTTRVILGVILGSLVLITVVVLVIEGAAGSATGTARRRICETIARQFTFQWRTGSSPQKMLCYFVKSWREKARQHEIKCTQDVQV